MSGPATPSAFYLAENSGAAVAILLSTFNGEAFLPAQLHSLRGQTHTNWMLHWRDDGSSDGTLRIMRDFAAQIGPERCVESPSSGHHLGAAASFLSLLRETAAGRIIAFADQDDVWLPDKLHCALARLALAGEAPALYCARQYRVDAELRGAVLSASYAGTPGFPACLTQNIANGNTVVMNAAAAALVATAREPEGAVHDWWSYIVVSAFGGQVMFDDRPQLLYRLHKGNLIGRAQPGLGRALAALRRGPAVYITMMRRHADALHALSARLSPETRRDLALIRQGLGGTLAARLRALRCPHFKRRTALENLLFRCWFLTNQRLLPSSQPAAASSKPAPARRKAPSVPGVTPP